MSLLALLGGTGVVAPPGDLNDPVAVADIQTFAGRAVPISQLRCGQFQANGVNANQQTGAVELGDAGIADHINYVADPGGSGAQVLQIRAASTDLNTPLTQGKIRAEISFIGPENWLVDKTTMWFCMRYWMTDRTGRTGHISPFQIHEARANPPLTEPPGAMYAESASDGFGNFIVRHNLSQAIDENIALPYGRWVNLAMKIHMDEDSPAGLLKLYMDGSLTSADHSGALGYDSTHDGKGYYIKFGAYYYATGDALTTGEETTYVDYAALLFDNGYSYQDIEDHLLFNAVTV